MIKKDTYNYAHELSLTTGEVVIMENIALIGFLVGNMAAEGLIKYNDYNELMDIIVDAGKQFYEQNPDPDDYFEEIEIFIKERLKDIIKE